MLDLLDQMHPERNPNGGMDVIIVVTSSQEQASFWHHNLEMSRGQVVMPKALVLAVFEDWSSGDSSPGAGNGLGTLYAYQQACIKAQAEFGIALNEQLANGSRVAMYHTAGMGMRLFPLVGAEHNHKAAVRLPNRVGTTTLLEAVIRQTAIYGAGRPGRLSVFWGDQIFIPSESPPVVSDAHVDILARLIPFPSRGQWDAQSLSQYGLVVNRGQRDAQLFEKPTYEDVIKLLAGGPTDENISLGVSLGAFSMSTPMLQALLDEFCDDLTMRRGRLDTDPHFWMPLTLSRDVYLSLSARDSAAQSMLGHHYDRMARFKERFMQSRGDAMALFKAVDVGSEGYWWDYGSVDAYYRNVRKLTGQNAESQAMRAFFDLDKRRDATADTLDSDDSSIVCGTHVQQGTIRNSVVVGVVADSIDVQDSVVLDSKAPVIQARESLLYHVLDENAVLVADQTVRADTLVEEEHRLFKMATQLGRNGKKDWQERLGDNPVSYAQLWQINQGGYQ